MAPKSQGFCACGVLRLMISLQLAKKKRVVLANGFHRLFHPMDRRTATKWNMRVPVLRRLVLRARGKTFQSCQSVYKLGGFNPSWKIFVQTDHVPSGRAENRNCLKPSSTKKCWFFQKKMDIQTPKTEPDTHQVALILERTLSVVAESLCFHTRWHSQRKTFKLSALGFHPKKNKLEKVPPASANHACTYLLGWSSKYGAIKRHLLGSLFRSFRVDLASEKINKTSSAKTKLNWATFKACMTSTMSHPDWFI